MSLYSRAVLSTYSAGGCLLAVGVVGGGGLSLLTCLRLTLQWMGRAGVRRSRLARGWPVHTENRADREGTGLDRKMLRVADSRAVLTLMPCVGARIKGSTGRAWGCVVFGK